jgi:hypothetical protein
MLPNPELDQAFLSFLRQRPMTGTDARHPGPAFFLELQRWVLRVPLEQGKAPVGMFLDFR